MPQKAEPKISVSEAVLIGMFLAILDVIDLIPLAGDLTDVAAAPLVLYYFMKHINGTAYIISWILDLIPVTQEFPSRSIVWWGTVIFERVAPAKLEQETEKVGELGEGGEGGEALEGGEGLEAGASEGAEASENAEQGVSSAEETEGGAETEGVEGETPAEENGGEGEGQEAGGETETPAEEEGGEGENPKEEGGEEGESEDGEDISETESEKNPLDVEEEDLFEGSGDDASSIGSDEDDEEESEQEEAVQNSAGNTIGIDSSKKWQRNQRNAKPTNQTTSAYDTKPKKKAA
jgi:hypothetical protein